MTHKRQALSVLIVSTLAFTVCFMVWMMFGVIGIPIKKALDLNATQFGLLKATQVQVVPCQTAKRAAMAFTANVEQRVLSTTTCA